MCNKLNVKSSTGREREKLNDFVMVQEKGCCARSSAKWHAYAILAFRDVFYWT